MFRYTKLITTNLSTISYQQFLATTMMYYSTLICKMFNGNPNLLKQQHLKVPTQTIDYSGFCFVSTFWLVQCLTLTKKVNKSATKIVHWKPIFLDWWDKSSNLNLQVLHSMGKLLDCSQKYLIKVKKTGLASELEQYVQPIKGINRCQ